MRQSGFLILRIARHTIFSVQFGLWEDDDDDGGGGSDDTDEPDPMVPDYLPLDWDGADA